MRNVVRMDWHFWGMPGADKGGFVAYHDYAKLEEESAGRMVRIEKLIALCYEHGVPMNAVLDTGLHVDAG